jgi:hypothetical protein
MPLRHLRSIPGKHPGSSGLRTAALGAVALTATSVQIGELFAVTAGSPDIIDADKLAPISVKLLNRFVC